MFDFAWTEIALIGVVALIAIGPKDLPVAIKAVAEMVKKARRMAGEFQTHVDEMVREANLDEVRSQINDIRSMDIKGMVERAVDSDGTLRGTLATNPLAMPYTPATEAAPAATPETRTLDRPVGLDPTPHADGGAPSFIPPSTTLPPPEAVTATIAAPPAFIPPSFVPHPAAPTPVAPAPGV